MLGVQQPWAWPYERGRGSVRGVAVYGGLGVQSF